MRLPSLRRAVGDKLKLARVYAFSLGKGWLHRAPFKDVRVYCTFIGYPRSGHSLVGSLLDAHPNMMIAHELDALWYLSAGFGKYQILHLISDNSRSAARQGRSETGYSYVVREQWQGSYQNLHVIGDKKGGKTTLRLRANPRLLETLQQTMGYSIRFLHVVRNPFDNVASMCRRGQRGQELDDNLSLYCQMCETNQYIRETVGPENVFDVRLENLVEDPQKTLAGVCRFLGVDPSEGYLEACSRIVSSSPSLTRNEIHWNQAAFDCLEHTIGQYPFLRGYRYED